MSYPSRQGTASGLDVSPYPAAETRPDPPRPQAAARTGDPPAGERLLGQVYDELHRVARGQMARERADHTLSVTALVHEAYLRLADRTSADEADRLRLVSMAARVMREILVDHARRRAARKRGGGWQRAPLTGLAQEEGPAPADLVALDGALEDLGRQCPRLRQVVELRFFAGLPDREIAALLRVTERTVQRDWQCARAWLYKELYSAEVPSP